MKVRIGIDPDIEKSGYCEIRNGKIRILDNLDLFDLVTCLSAWEEDHLVCIEAGWLNKKTNFHFAKNKGVSDKISMAVGQNHAVGKLIEQYCVKHEIPYKLVAPTGAKWDAKLFKQITGWEGKSNQENRDAARAAW